MLTDPGVIASWWGPKGFSKPEITSDLRVGGGYRFAMRPPQGSVFHLSGEFLEIDAPKRLVYTFRWEEPDPNDRETVVVLSLLPVGRATEVLLRQGDFATDGRLSLHANGWEDSFTKLNGLIEAPRSRVGLVVLDSSASSLFG